MNIVIILYLPIEIQMGHKSSDSTTYDHLMETLSDLIIWSLYGENVLINGL